MEICSANSDIGITRTVHAARLYGDTLKERLMNCGESNYFCRGP